MCVPSSFACPLLEKTSTRGPLLRLGGALVLIALGAGCTSAMDSSYWDRSPARAVAYNRYVPAGTIRYNPRVNTGVAYLPGGDFVSTTTRTSTVTSSEKEVVEVERY